MVNYLFRRVRAMRLKFDGLAMVDTRVGVVNFVGYYVDEASRQHDVLCRVARDVLERLSGLSNPTPDDLLTAYRQQSDRINLMASAQYAAGLSNPHITSADLPCGRTGGERVA
jgi:hypothetical protein